jgi:hypothetical protein
MPKENQQPWQRQPWTWRRWLPPAWRPFAASALVVLFAVAWWGIPELLYRHMGAGREAKLRAITDTRTALLAGLLGVGALLTFRLNSRGQMTDRYSKAIDQLGSNQLDVRLGGIYALEQIAVDSERYHTTVVEMLSAFVREHSDPVYRWRQHSAQFQQERPIPKEEEERDQAYDHVKLARYLLPDDVQVAVTVLGRLPPTHGSRGNLNGAYLAGAALDGANLSHTSLVAATLSDGNHHRANLSGAHLDGAQLQGAHLDRGQLQNAHLDGAQLQDAHLDGAQLQGAYLDGAQLQGAYLDGVQLRGACLKGARLNGVQLRGACLKGACLKDADLSGAQLQRARSSANTDWPTDVDWKAHGVILEKDEETADRR